MFNLLPDQDKAALRREYNFRRALVYMGGIIAVMTLSLAFLVPVYVITYYKYHSVDVQYNSIIHARDGSEQAYIKDIKKINSLLDVLKDTHDLRSEAIFKLIIDAKQAGVTIIKIGYIRESQINIRMEGVADNRESLRSFTKALSQIKGLKVGELPISEFVRDAHIPFALDMVLTT